MKKTILTVCLGLGALGVFLLFPNECLAQYGDFESRMSGLSNKLVTVVLPSLSLLGLIYSAFLGLSGSAEGKQKMIVVIFCSVFGLLAPFIINFLKSAVGY